MEPEERQFVLDQLASSEARILELVKGLTPEQWSFREAPERWSIADNIEHLVAFEVFIPQMIAKAIERPAEPEKRVDEQEKDSLVRGLAGSRHTKLNAREALRPVAKWQDASEMVAELRKARVRTVAFVAETHANLRDHFFRHIAFGDLDCYQWLMLIGQHTYRHALQIEEIKANVAYPGGGTI
jgi:DinB superfamily